MNDSDILTAVTSGERTPPRIAAACHVSQWGPLRDNVRRLCRDGRLRTRDGWRFDVAGAR